ncbi:MAG: hypothetical protein HOV94_34575 [Saccharothrix sp.]|nr:hypothetical protein [Saccharothrix sp.]
MSTDVEVRTEQPAAVEAAPVQLAPTSTIASLAAWAAEARAANLLAQSLVSTSFVPAHFRGKPAEATAAILTGHELGLSPMASLRAIFVISGTPGMYAKAMVAVVMSQGHEVWVEEQTDERVVVCGRRKGSEHIARTVWDTARVNKAKLRTNSKYTDSPQQMMTARGQAEICRQIAPDALHGIPYAVEELRDMRSDDADVPAAEDGRITAAEILGEVVDDEPAGGE